ncbi:TetR/AcrR family transcriptional regulator [Microbacterium resistens]|uniref:TetR/AcrR family transcriptional regulator n=1 Tax=Microbacterium resistens TaxID=156977 RepID=UPI001C5786AF|nr:TetR/AcrR family transcriptional regulator [Microbacterium resistens]MBW1638687.1 TetR/AcrR family transcriptional regulator [Microbacterium resistens]
MSYSNTEPVVRRPGRPRDAAREREILAIVLAVMRESGVEAVTFEEIARRAEASKRTLYRRWATKQEMIVAAIKAGPASGNSPEPIDTGSLRGDLLALLERLETTMAAGEPIGLTLLQAGLRDPELCEHIEASAGPTGARLPDTVLRAAIARGELPPTADPFSYEEVGAAVLLLRTLNGLSTDAAYREALVDAVLIPALRSGVAAGQRGIFSGAPTPSPVLLRTNRENR